MANSNRFADAIKRIVEPLIPDQTGDSTFDEKSGISGTRGVGYGGTSGSSLSGSPGSTSAPATPKTVVQSGTDAAVQAAVDAATAALFGANGATQGAYAAQDLLDLAAGPSIKEALAGSVDGALDTLYPNELDGSKLLQLDGLKKCGDTSGKELKVRTDGFYIPPVGWDTANDPPVDPSYIAGKVWTLLTGATRLYSQTFNGLVNARKAVDLSTAYATSGGFVTSLNPTEGDNILFSLNPGGHVGDPTGPLGGTAYVFQAGNSIGAGQYGQVDCGTYPGDTAECAAAAPTATQWPITGTYQLSLQSNGQFMPNQYDSEVPIEYSTPRSTLSACTTSGTPVQLTPIKGGGFAFYETSGGNATGVVQLYNSDKTLKGYTDATGLLNYLP